MKKLLYPLTILAVPVFAFAQGGRTGGVEKVLDNVQYIISLLVPIIIGIAVLMFLWGIAQYITAKDPEKQKEARSIIIYGVIVLFAMVAIWGLVEILADTLGIKTGDEAGAVAPSIPVAR